ALAKVHNHDNVDTNLINQAVQAMLSFEQSNVVNHSKTEITSDRNIIPYSQYNSVNSFDPTLSKIPTKVEVPKELPKVSMVNTSLKKLKHHLAGFDVVDQYLVVELSEVQNVFHQIEQTVEQHRLE
nr:hypothetical protein [Tanacetum cinerariifolium]